jgi:hypothetical protein
MADQPQLAPISVFDLAALIFEDAKARLGGGHLSNEKIAGIVDMPKSSWNKLYAGSRETVPSDKTFVTLTNYLATLTPPLVGADGVAYKNVTWSELAHLDALAREASGITKRQAYEELMALKERERELLKIIYTAD